MYHYNLALGHTTWGNNPPQKPQDSRASSNSRLCTGQFMWELDGILGALAWMPWIHSSGVAGWVWPRLPAGDFHGVYQERGGFSMAILVWRRVEVVWMEWNRMECNAIWCCHAFGVCTHACLNGMKWLLYSNMLSYAQEQAPGKIFASWGLLFAVPNHPTIMDSNFFRAMFRDWCW